MDLQFVFLCCRIWRIFFEGYLYWTIFNVFHVRFIRWISFPYLSASPFSVRFLTSKINGVISDICILSTAERSQYDYFEKNMNTECESFTLAVKPARMTPDVVLQHFKQTILSPTCRWSHKLESINSNTIYVRVRHYYHSTAMSYISLIIL